MMAGWSDLRQELALWRQDGRALPFWWRDDDAVSQTQALDQLLELTDACPTPIALAVIPKHADASLVGAVKDRAQVCVLQHGWAHLNHAAPDAKKSEFPMGRDARQSDISEGFKTLNQLFGAQFSPVFVPPWNRIGDDTLAHLGPLGLVALSTFTPRQTPFAAPGVAQINTHIDPIFWRGGGGLVAEDQLLAHTIQTLKQRRDGQADNVEPLGILTHHLVHDAAIWAFTERLVKTLLSGGAVAINIAEYKEALP